MKYISTPLMILVFLVACNDDETPSQKALAASLNSPLTAYMNRENVCDIISIQMVQKILKLKSPVTTRVESYSGYTSCKYSWEGVSSGEFTLTLSMYDKKRETFPPKKLSEKEMINTIGDAATLVRSESEFVLTTVTENTKLTIMMENPPRSESIKLIAKHILKGVIK